MNGYKNFLRLGRTVCLLHAVFGWLGGLFILYKAVLPGVGRQYRESRSFVGKRGGSSNSGSIEIIN